MFFYFKKPLVSHKYRLGRDIRAREAAFQVNYFTKYSDHPDPCLNNRFTHQYQSSVDYNNFSLKILDLPIIENYEKTPHISVYPHADCF
jgi:hypothetical protein